MPELPYVGQNYNSPWAYQIRIIDSNVENPLFNALCIFNSLLTYLLQQLLDVYVLGVNEEEFDTLDVFSMTILVVGGCQIYGYGLTLQQRSFIDYFLKQLEGAGHCPQVTSYVFLPLADVRETLAHLDLSQFDLLIIQPAHYYLQHPSTFWKLFRTPASKKPTDAGPGLQSSDLDALRSQPTLPLDRTPVSWVKKTKRVLKRMLLDIAKPMGLVKQLLYVQQELAALLEQLQDHRQRIIVLTPTPHREIVSQWLRKQGRNLVMLNCTRLGITVLDTHSVIRPQDDVYIPDDPSHFNALGHELLGRALFDSYETKLTLSAGVNWVEELSIETV